MDPLPQETATRAGPSRLTGKKRKEADDPEDDGDVIEISSDVAYEDDEIFEADPPPRPQGGRKPSGSGARGAGSRPDVMNVDSDPEEWNGADSEDDDVWVYSHRPKPRQRRRTKSPPTMADFSDF